MQKKIGRIICLGAVFISMSCAIFLKETHILTSEKRTDELLGIHSEICPVIPFERDSSKIIFFSDLHRGMGENDVFKNNKKLFTRILEYYFNQGFSLVLIGDLEEGWGFQRDNIPLILDEHGEEFAWEKKFWEANRYYRIYGNHDDFFRGELLNFGVPSLQRAYPALIFSDSANQFRMFISHGCQGQGLHDAGDELASWGVYAKYNWWLEIFPKKLKSEKELIQKMDAVQDDLEKHEEMVFKWTLNQKDARGDRKYQILIAGHTHIPVFNSIPDPNLYQVMLQDIDSGKYIFFNNIFEDSDTLTSIKLSESLKEEMKKRIRAKLTELNTMTEATRDPFYFNTGCGFHSKMSCIEISGGKIYLKLLGFDDQGKIDFDSYVDAGDLKSYGK